MSEGTCSGQIFWGVGDHFQVLEVSEGTCTVLCIALSIVYHPNLQVDVYNLYDGSFLVSMSVVFVLSGQILTIIDNYS